MSTTLGVPRETSEDENRVPITPESIPKLINSGIEVLVESGAGDSAYFTDDMYREVGANIIEERNTLFSSSHIVVSIQCPIKEDVSKMRNGSILIGLLFPDKNQDVIQEAKSLGINAFSLEKLPRSTRAQSMDVLTSQSSITGYVGAVVAASNSPRLMPMLSTAAGTIKPSSVLVLGAGVAGLMSIATCRRLGAIVTAYDVRKASEEEVKSLGARFLNLDIEATSTGGYARELTEEERQKQQEVLVKAMVASDVVITTASVPGKKAPLLVSKDAVESMRPGSIVVDLSADSGGNCQLTKRGEVVEHKGVKIFGLSNPPSRMPVNASNMYSRNLTAFLQLIVKNGEIDGTFQDELLKACLVSNSGSSE